MRAASLTVLLLALIAVAGLASAHGPPTKRDQDTRLLADHNDDCGGHGPTDPDRCHGTHDLIGLDVVERHDGGLGDVVVFRFFLNGGSGNLRDVLSLKVEGVAKTFELRTSDNSDFQTTGFESVSKSPVYLDGTTTQDGTRFIVEATVKRAALGGVGATLSDYKVEAYAGGSKGDYMPGGYVSGLGVDNPNPDQGDDVTSFSRQGGYALRGPTYYATLPGLGEAQVPADGQVTLPIPVTNALRGTGQLATLAVSGADGFTATWVGANGADPASLDLPKGGTATAELRLRGDGHAPASGTLTLTLTTSLGGRSVHELPYRITAAQPTSEPTDGSAGAEDAPAPAAALLAVAVLALAARRRRA